MILVQGIFRVYVVFEFDSQIPVICVYHVGSFAVRFIYTLTVQFFKNTHLAGRTKVTQPLNTFISIFQVRTNWFNISQERHFTSIRHFAKFFAVICV